MSRNKILLSFDIEECDLPEEFRVEIPKREKNQISADGTRGTIVCNPPYGERLGTIRQVEQLYK